MRDPKRRAEIARLVRRPATPKSADAAQAGRSAAVAAETAFKLDREVRAKILHLLCEGYVLQFRSRTTPAMAANVTKHLWEVGDIVDVLEAWENTK